MLSRSKDIMGLVGPSGVGKGFSKQQIENIFAGQLTQPVVATTRKRRDNDGPDRLSGLDTETFKRLLQDEQVVFAHQPFGNTGDWYGFIRESFSANQPILTEVHIENVLPFRHFFGSRLALVGMIASQPYLEANLEARNTETVEEKAARVAASLTEIESILTFYEQGHIDHLIEVNSDNRKELGSLMISLAAALLSLT